jgi:hypothetical protein
MDHKYYDYVENPELLSGSSIGVSKPSSSRSQVRACMGLVEEPGTVRVAIERPRSDRPGAGIMPPGSHGDKPAGWTLGSPARIGRRSCPCTGLPCTYRSRSAPSTPTCTARTGSYSRTPAPGDPAAQRSSDCRQKPRSTPAGGLYRHVEVGNISCDGAPPGRNPDGATPPGNTKR